MWTFVAKKERQLRGRETTDPRLGDQYLFIALDPRTKLIAAHEVGKRDYPTTERFLRKLRDRLASPFELQFYTDGFLKYPAAITRVFADLIDHAQVIAPKRDPDEMREYGEGLKGKKLRIVKWLGLPDDEKIGTSYVERANGTVRQQMRRFTRKTQGFSKKHRGTRRSRVRARRGWPEPRCAGRG
ncbi:MAG: DDE-type integrase/transposase/recombinase [Acidobacteria bacterium]|nr:DDE-type integrase/transposase/recombinase [Acidobacteriota bacterium]